MGMAGPVTNSIGNQACIRADYGDIADLPVFAESYTAAHQGVIFEIEMLALFCAAIRRPVYAEIGPLDEQFEMGMFEDDDYAMRLHAHGYRLVCTEEVFIHHWGGAGFHLLGAVRYLEIFSANLERFEEKWQIRWSPPLYREELRGQQMRGLVDDKLQLAAELRAQQAAMAERESKIIEVERENARLRILLNGTYASRGWKLVASLQRARGRLFPNGSRRDRALRACGRAGLGLWRFYQPSPIPPCFIEPPRESGGTGEPGALHRGGARRQKVWRFLSRRFPGMCRCTNGLTNWPLPWRGRNTWSSSARPSMDRQPNLCRSARISIV